MFAAHEPCTLMKTQGIVWDCCTTPNKIAQPSKITHTHTKGGYDNNMFLVFSAMSRHLLWCQDHTHPEILVCFHNIYSRAEAEHTQVKVDALVTAAWRCRVHCSRRLRPAQYLGFHSLFHKSTLSQSDIVPEGRVASPWWRGEIYTFCPRLLGSMVVKSEL